MALPDELVADYPPADQDLGDLSDVNSECRAAGQEEDVASETEGAPSQTPAPVEKAQAAHTAKHPDPKTTKAEDILVRGMSIKAMEWQVNGRHGYAHDEATQFHGPWRT